MEYRIEHDTMGEVKVPADKYWGAQTQRSYENFRIGREKMPVEIVRAFGILKKAAALSNMELGMLDKRRGEAIVRSCDEVIDGGLDEHFPLVVYQTGSGTQTNMNANEVIAGRANEMAGEKILHPNDHVNKSQSSNDTFPTAMHIAAVVAIEDQLIPSISKLKKTFIRQEEQNKDIIKCGRTHLQDATPLTLGQEISGWRNMLEQSELMIKDSLTGIRQLAIGGTAVGTGLNAHKDFGILTAQKVSEITGKKFISEDNKFHGLTSKDALVFAHGAIKALACNLMKIANDIRWLSSGPRCGIGELIIPENEPGSSIMPGKVNPTQCEAVTMACVQVMGNDVAVGLAASQGNFQLNVYMPVLIYNFLESVNLMATAMVSFNDNCAIGIRANIEKIDQNMKKSLMLVTALNPHIGYENAAKVAKLAHKENINLREAVVKLGFMTEQEFDKIVVPADMVHPNGNAAFSLLSIQ